MLKNSLPGYDQFSKFNPSIKGEMSPKIKLASPKVLSTYTPMAKKSDAFSSFAQASNTFSPFGTVFKKAVSPSSKKEEGKKETKKEKEIDFVTSAINEIDLNKITHSKFMNMKVTKLAKPEGDISPLVTNTTLNADERNMYVCLCGKILVDSSATLCDECMENDKNHEMNGTLYGLDQKTNDFVKVWGVMQEKEIFLYENQNDLSKPSKIVTLVDCYVSKNCYLSLSFKGKQYLGFQLQSSKNSVNFYTETKEEKEKWITAINSVINCANINEFYEMKGVLGRGRFGVVREAVHKQTGTLVAIKGLIKSKMKPEDLEMIRREIEILKICHHPNVIKLHDYFETDQYVFMIIDILSGSDLVNYFSHHNFLLSESVIAIIIIQLLKAVEYIHSIGIIHRDIKGENILISDFSSEPILKLSDFGLSKIIGSNEKCSESYGTLGYAAPELYLQKPYDKSVDIWGIGVVAFSLLSKGQMPFDASSDKDIIW